MFCFLALLAIASYLVYSYLTWHFGYWAKRNVPHAEPRPFLGTLPNEVLQKRHVFYDLHDVYELNKGQYHVAGLYSMRSPQLMILDPALAKDVLISNFKSFHDNEIVDLINKKTDPILANNPFMAAGAEWKERRNEITPGFTANRMKAMYPLFKDACKNMVEYLAKEARIGNPDGVEAREFTSKFTTDIVSHCIFSVDAGSFKDENAKMHEMGKKVLEPGFRFVLTAIIQKLCPILQNVIPISLFPKHVAEFFTGILRQAMDMRVASGDQRDDYLNHLLMLREKKNLSDTKLVAHALSFFIDGFETSSIAMAFLLYELAKNPRVQEKLREEIREAEKRNELTFEGIAELPYLDQVVNESLRLNPPILTLAKKCTADCSLPLKRDGTSSVVVEKGIIITIPLYSIHRDPEYYEEPLTFLPERFDESNGGVKSFKDKGVFLPFGDGPRVCLGMRFASTQVRAGIVEILRNFSITVNKKTQEPFVMNPQIFLNYPSGGLWLDFKPL